MIKVEASIQVLRPAAVCFRFIADDFFHNYPRWSPEVVRLEALSGGAVRVGTLGYQVRVDLGHRSEDRFRVVLLQKDRRVVFRGISRPFVVDYRLDSQGSQARITFAFALERLTPIMRPFEGPIRRATQEGAERVVRNLKRLIESEPPRNTRTA